MALANFYVWLSRDIEQLENAVAVYEYDRSSAFRIEALVVVVENIIDDLRGHLQEMERVSGANGTNSTGDTV